MGSGGLKKSTQQNSTLKQEKEMGAAKVVILKIVPYPTSLKSYWCGKESTEDKRPYFHVKGESSHKY